MKRLMIVLLFLSFINAIHSQNIENINVSQLSVKLNFPDTVPLVTQLAIFKDNPLDYYDSLIALNQKKIKLILEPIVDSNLFRVQFTSMLTFFWDRVFENVSGYEVVTLSSRPNDKMIYTISDPTGMYYVATKITYFGEYFSCWCMPVQLQPGKEIMVELNKDNYLNLIGLFNYNMARIDSTFVEKSTRKVQTSRSN